MAEECCSDLGPQNIDAWERDRIAGDFDYVIIGSSFCATGFIHQVLKNNPKAKIFIMERGDYPPPEHFHSLSPHDLRREEKDTETFPWNISDETDAGEYIRQVRGMNNLFGGRSSYWKAWCPEPTEEEMAEWPDEVIKKVHEYFPKAKKLLNVQPVHEIREDKGNRMFGQLQDIIFEELKSTPSDVEAITRVEHTPLAIVGSKSKRYGDHQKYSVLEPLLKILKEKENVRAAVNCLVKKIHHENGSATILETNRGDFTLGKAKLILAMSTLPSTTIMLNSFSPSQLGSIGKRFTAHFFSFVCARVPFGNTEMYSALEERTPGKPEMAAMYVAGENEESKHQFHNQLTAVTVRDENSGVYDTVRNLLKTPSDEQLISSSGHIVFMCASLGQLDHHNPKNRFRLNRDADVTCNTAVQATVNEDVSIVDITCNATLQVTANEKDKALWDTMDRSAFEILERLTPAKGAIEYWNSDTKSWQRERPSTKQIRLKSVVHPASTMWIGRESSSPVNLDYQFRGVDNVYLTGGALWPTGASWNPTCTMTALAMDLADKLSIQA